MQKQNIFRGTPAPKCKRNDDTNVFNFITIIPLSLCFIILSSEKRAFHKYEESFNKYNLPFSFRFPVVVPDVDVIHYIFSTHLQQTEKILMKGNFMISSGLEVFTKIDEGWG